LLNVQTLAKVRSGSRAPVVHACNPSYSGGRDQEALGSKPAPANSSRDPILKTPSKNRADGAAQGAGPEFKPQYCKKKKKVPSGLESCSHFHESFYHFS
jgi:hypothetical protein